MIRLCYSNRFEELVTALTRDLAQAPQADDIFAARHIIVPNRQVATYVKLAVAREAGIAANLRFPFLESFLAERAAAKSELRAIDRSRMHALLCGILADETLVSGEEMAPVRGYLRAAGRDRDARELRRYQLAAQLSGLFVEYGVTRPELVGAWPEGRALDGTEHARTEAWQRRLWLAMFGEPGALARLHAERGVAWLALPELLQRVPVVEMNLPPSVYVIGFSYFAPVYQRVFAKLAEKTALHIYSLNPCEEFWEDLRAGRAPDPDDDENPALRLWGRPGREHARLLNQLSEFDFEARFPDPVEERDTLLARLQHDILTRAPEPTSPSHAPAAPDGSIRILACPSIRRELEIIGNEIWSLVRADPTLQFNQIAVLISRRDLDRYQAHVGSVFGELHGLPHNLADLPLASASRIAEALELLLDLPFGKFTRPELLRLLLHPAVLARYPDVDPVDWAQWVEALGVVHGADRADHDGTYIERDLYNWDQGVRRLALGAFMAGERSGEAATVGFGGHEYVPLDLPRDALPSAGRLAALIRSLISDARYCRDRKMPLAEWSVFLELLASSYLTPSDSDEERALTRCRHAIEQLAALDLDGAPVGYRTACELVRSQLGDLRGARGEYLAHGVTVAPLAPMTALPFRVIFAAGLGEGGFPSTEHDSPLDLREARRERSDVGPRERDRYLFLETLLAARERLYLSYVARDELTNEPLEPSAVVLELEHMLRGYLGRNGVAALTVTHPLRDYDLRYFPELLQSRDEPALVSAARSARERAQVLALRRHLEANAIAPGDPVPHLDLLRSQLDGRHWSRLAALLRLVPPVDSSADAPRRMALSLPLDALRKFLECPLQGWATWVLRLREGAAEDLADRADEPFETSIGPTAGLLREVFSDHLETGGDVDALLRLYRDRAALLELRGAAPTGLFSTVERAQHQQTLAAWHDALSSVGDPDAVTWTTYGFGRAREDQSVGQLLPPITVALPIGASTSGSIAPEAPLELRVELHGRTGPIGDPGVGSLVVSTSDKPQQKHLLRGFIDHLALTASGQRAGAGHAITLVTATGKASHHSLAAWSRDAAQGFLESVLGEMLSEPHAYLLPCEAVFAHHDKPDRSLLSIIEGLRNNDRSSFSSRYGPVSRLEEYEVPDAATADGMVERRFGPLFDLLDREDG